MSSSWLPALLILAAVVATYVLVIVVDAVASVRRRKLRGKRRGSRWRRRLPVALVVGAIVSLLFAFGRVRLDRRVTSGTVVLAIDVSHSMGATDVQPNRLAAAKVAAATFLDRLPVGFRVGLATFSVTSAVPIAPTSDRTRVSAALGSLAVDPGTGTVIGDGLSAALDAIQADRGQEGDRPAAVVLLSDGMDSGSTIPPEQAASRAAELSVPVFTVAIGQPPTEPSGVSASTGGSAAAGAPSDVLARIADETGAKAYTTQTADQLTQVYDTLGSRLSTELAIDESAGPFVIAAIAMALLAAGVLLIGTRDPYA
ncbi:MAG: VWA domain-containing protein [Actinomycetota bacterium]